MRLHHITERLSDVVYHTTLLSSATKIIEDNRFALSSGLSTSEEPYNRGRWFYLSTARSSVNGFNRMFALDQRISVTFKLDGRSLGHRYSAKALDFFGNSNMSGETELEDRIVSNNPLIPDAKKYIIDISVNLYGRELAIDEYNDVQVLFNSGKPVYLYDDAQQYLIQNKKSSLSLDDISYSEDRDSVDNATPRGNQKFDPIEDTHIGELWYKDEITNDNKEIVKDFIYSSPDYIERTVKRNMSEITKKSPDFANKLNRDMRSQGINSIPKLITHLQLKWNKIWSVYKQ